VLTSRLAIGPMPRSQLHWQQLEEAGFLARFSCCYPDEEIFAPIPEHWRSAGVALPDHREQEPMQPERLDLAITTARNLLEADAPMYLHCWAGRERSALIAVGLMVQERGGDLFAALEWVRRCHPAASPIYGHLEILDQLLLKQNRK
jgi:protein-tyrosine phosphatase